jgi:hypothetical protein
LSRYINISMYLKSKLLLILRIGGSSFNLETTSFVKKKILITTSKTLGGAFYP